VKRFFVRRHGPDAEALSAYLDGELDSEAAESLRAHLSTCEACTGALDALHETQSHVRALPQAEVPRSFRIRPSDVEAARGRVPQSRGSAVTRWSPMLGGAAAAVFVVVVGAEVLSQSSTPAAQDTVFQSRENTGMLAPGEAADVGRMESHAGVEPPDPGLTASPEGETVPSIKGLDGQVPDAAGGPSTNESGQNLTAPTGAPPDGDATLPEPSFGESAGSELAPAAKPSPGSEFVPPTATPPTGVGARDGGGPPLPGAPVVTTTPAEPAAVVTGGTENGNRSWLRIVQIAAAAVAVVAGGVFITARMRERSRHG
jgi:hypothetical protein